MIPRYLEILYGAWIAGLTVVPINSKLHPKEVAFILEDSGAAVLFASERCRSGAAAALASVEACGTRSSSAATTTSGSSQQPAMAPAGRRARRPRLAVLHVAARPAGRRA